MSFDKTTDKTINVLMSGNDKVLDGIRLCALSIMKHTPVPVHLYIMSMNMPGRTDGIKQEAADSLRDILKTFNTDNDVTLFDVWKDYEECFVNSPNSSPMYTPFSLLRLFAERYIDTERLIYLDADTMTNASLEEFYSYDIADKELAVVSDYMGKFWIKKDYFNSGVLFINMPKIRELQTFKKAIELLKVKKYVFSDQTALYKVSTRRLYLPSRFNEQRNMHVDTVIKHFCKGTKWFPIIHQYNVKQWQRNKVHKTLKIHEFDDVYQMYDKFFPQ